MTEPGCGCDEIILPLGADGVDGKNAFTITTGGFVQPAVLSGSVSIPVSNTGLNGVAWAAPGQVIIVSTSSAAYEFYQVVSSTTTTITAVNLGYSGLIAPTTTVTAPSTVAPSGIRGPQGATGPTGGIGPVGPAGTASTLVRTYVDTSIRSVPNTSGFSLIPNQTFSASTLCPQNGDAGKIKGHFALIGVAPNNLGRATDVDFFIGKTGVSFVAITPMLTAGPTFAYNEQLLLRNIDLQFFADYSFVSFEITIKRISSTSSMILVEWRLMNLATPGLVGSYIGSSLTTGSIDFNAGSFIDFAVRSNATFALGGINVSAASLTVEKIIQ
jgi:hypothetical protein